MFLAATALALLVLTVAAARASAFAPSPQSASFSLHGSNGFAVDVSSRGGEVTVIASERRPPLVTISPEGLARPAGTGNGASSIYLAPAGADRPGVIDAGLGTLGRISVRFHPSGRVAVSTLAGVCGRPTRIVRRLGTFAGTISFQGEGGYTAVAASSARGSVGTPLPVACEEPPAQASFLAAGSTAAPPTGSGAILTATDAAAGSSFRAATGAGGVGFRAAIEERRADGVTVVRRAYAGAPSGAFGFGGSLAWAAVRPPAPFSGSARFAAADQSWKGNLRVTFPGLSVPLTGTGFEPRLRPSR